MDIPGLEPQMSAHCDRLWRNLALKQLFPKQTREHKPMPPIFFEEDAMLMLMQIKEQMREEEWAEQSVDQLSAEILGLAMAAQNAQPNETKKSYKVKQTLAFLSKRGIINS